MKPRLELMLARAEKLIVNQPRTLALIKCNRAAVRNRSGQSPVAVMLRNDLVISGGGLPFQHTRLRLVPDHKRHVYVGRVLLLAVNPDGRVVRGRAKRVSHLQVAAVDVRAGIDDERATARADFDAQRIVVSVRAAAVYAGSARIETQVAIVFAHDVEAGIGKRSRQCGGRRKVGIVKDCGAGVQDIGMIVRVMRFHRQYLAAVSVTNERRESVGTEITADKKKHLAQLVPIPLIDRDPMCAAEDERVEKEFGDEAMVTG